MTTGAWIIHCGMAPGGSEQLAWRRILLHPAWILVAGVIVTQGLGDRHYPFSNFAMYAHLDDEATYLYLADDGGAPLPTYEHVGLSAAKINKMFHSALRVVCRRRRERVSRASPEALSEAAQSLMVDLRELNRTGGGTALPPRVRVVRVTVGLANGQLIQSPTVVGEG